MSFRRRNGGLCVEVVEGSPNVLEEGLAAPVRVDLSSEEVHRL